MVNSSDVPFDSATHTRQEYIQAWLMLAGVGAIKEWFKLMFSGDGDHWMFFVYLNGYNEDFDAQPAPWEYWRIFSWGRPKKYRTHDAFLRWYEEMENRE
ncbi:MAG TPA: hypothetical protein V6C57_27395 [Coleofasciculaceae cyanobacterium]